MISATQMAVIARVEQYSDGMLYRWPGGFWSEIFPLSGEKFSRFTHWHVRTRIIEDMLEAGLASVFVWFHSKNASYPIAVKIKAP